MKIGIHEDVLMASFGTGNISFTRGRFEDKKSNTCLFFYNQDEPRKIGEVSNDDAGKSTDELPKPEICFEFSKPESITALVHSLLELQKDLFDAQDRPVMNPINELNPKS